MSRIEKLDKVTIINRIVALYPATKKRRGRLWSLNKRNLVLLYVKALRKKGIEVED